MGVLKEKIKRQLDRIIGRPVERVMGDRFDSVIGEISNIIDKLPTINEASEDSVNKENIEGEILKKQAIDLGIPFEKVLEIVDLVKPYTMIPDNSQYFNIISTVKTIKENKKGIFVECGTWKGGSSLAMLLAQREFFGEVKKTVYLLDSFEGLPLVDEIDGKSARVWQENKESPEYFDNCTASIEEVISMLNKFGFIEGDYHIIKGWFENTVPLLSEKIKDTKIALLRLDGDWYESTKVCLDNLMPIVEPGCTVIIDDYFAWDGCTIAVNEYLGVNKLPYRIRTIANNLGAYFYKEE